MPATLRYIDADMVTVYETGADGKKHRLATLLWGDNVRVKGKSGGFWKLDFTTRVWDPAKGHYIWKKHDAFIDGDVAFRDDPLLKVRFVDVGQGDINGHSVVLRLTYGNVRFLIGVGELPDGDAFGAGGRLSYPIFMV